MRSVLQMRPTASAFAIAAFLVLCPFTVPAQNTTGRITGQVIDSSQAAIADVTLNAVHLSTGQNFKATSDSSGLYVIPNMPVGAYRLTVEHAGFDKKIMDNVTVDVDQVVRLNVVLGVGQVTQQIEVTSEAPVIDTADPAVGVTLQNQQISQLPINGRDYARFSLLSPGAVLRSSEIADLTFNGLQSGNNQFSMDGIDATRVDAAYMSNGSERRSFVNGESGHHCGVQVPVGQLFGGIWQGRRAPTSI